MCCPHYNNIPVSRQRGTDSDHSEHQTWFSAWYRLACCSPLLVGALLIWPNEHGGNRRYSRRPPEVIKLMTPSS